MAGCGGASKPRRWWAGGTTAFLLVAVGCAPVGPPDEELLLPPVESVEAREYLERLAAASRDDPADVGPRGELCLALEANHLWESAASCLERLHRDDPAEAWVAFHRSEVARSLGDEAAAVDWLATALELDPAFAAAYDRKGDRALRSGDLEAADDAFRRLIELAPDAPQGFFGRARVQLERGEAEAALEAADEGLRRDPTALWGYYLRGRARRELGDERGAAVDLARGAGAARPELRDARTLRLPDHARTPTGLLAAARGARSRGDLAAATALARRAVEAAPEDLEALRLLAVLELDTGHPDRSCTVAERALRVDESDLEAHLQLANCHLASGDAVTALAHAERAIELAPRVARGHQMKARALITCCEDQLGEATVSLDRALELAPSDPQIQRDLGHALLLAGDPRSAREIYASLARERPWEVWGFLGLARAEGTMGDLEAALSAIEEATRLSPQHPAVQDLRRRLGMELP